MSGIALGLAGDTARAAHLADDLAKRFPEDTIVQSNYLPTIRAAFLLRSGNGTRAREALTPAESHELGGNVENLNFVLYPVYLRGVAYLAGKKASDAAAEFQKVLDHPGAVRSEPIGALARLGLGRAFRSLGDQEQSRRLLIRSSSPSGGMPTPTSRC